jgi:glutathione S-transferase
MSEKLANPSLVGRSSSSFTRIARMFALELGVEHAFRVVPDLRSSEVADYAGNPALRIPTLVTVEGAWFGALNICRELARRSKRDPAVVWPEHLDQPLAANAQELVLQALASEVTLIMAKLEGVAAESPQLSKTRTSLLNILRWLEQNWTQAVAALPPARNLSYLEVTLFCLVTHLEFREVLPLGPYPELTRFCTEFGAQTSATETAYRFDA